MKKIETRPGRPPNSGRSFGAVFVIYRVGLLQAAAKHRLESLSDDGQAQASDVSCLVALDRERMARS